jgi:amino-acid N-acetyltransferase
MTRPIESYIGRGWALRAARPDDLEATRKLLRDCELPLEGIEDPFGDGFAVAEGEGALVGIAGVERYGHVGLLRSVAVAPSRRAGGLGSGLVDDRIAWARRHDISTLYLLTTTAAPFFARRGFVEILRSDAPAEIQGSREFSQACPASATLMRRGIG